MSALFVRDALSGLQHTYMAAGAGTSGDPWVPGTLTAVGSGNVAVLSGSVSVSSGLVGVLSGNVNALVSGGRVSINSGLVAILSGRVTVDFASGQSITANVTSVAVASGLVGVLSGNLGVSGSVVLLSGGNPIGNINFVSGQPLLSGFVSLLSGSVSPIITSGTVAILSGLVGVSSGNVQVLQTSGQTSIQSGQISLTPNTSGGLDPYSFIWPANVSGVSIKASPGQVCGWYFVNRGASGCMITLHDTAQAANNASGTVRRVRFPLMASGGANAMPGTVGIQFNSGIGLLITAEDTDTSTLAVISGTVVGDFFYK